LGPSPGCAGEVALSRLSIAADGCQHNRLDFDVATGEFSHGFFFSTECLPWIQISQDFIGLGFAAGTIQGDHALFACAPLYVPHVRRVFGEKKCHALDAFSNGPTNLDPFETQQKRQQVLELAVLAG